MRIAELVIENFRNLAMVELRPGPGVNFITGPNASGKTSLLEAIHFLARVRSFRTTRPQQLVRHGSDALLVRASLAESQVRLAVRWSANGTQVRINGEDVRTLSSLARFLPVQVVNAESQRILLDGPQVRRSFLDWGLFHVEQSYYDSWRRYDRALRQRNLALRSKDARLSKSWEPELALQAAALTRYREDFIALLKKTAKPLLADWLPDESIDFEYRRGWPQSKSLEQAYTEGRERELELGYSLYGPHRADLLVRASGMEAQHRLSRGQQKLLAIAMLLAAAAVMHEDNPTILLIDDLPAELDVTRRKHVLDQLQRIDAQVFITATDPAALPVAREQARWFHVEHGRYREVV